MVAGRTLLRASVVAVFLAAPVVWFACSEGSSPTGPGTTRSALAGLRSALDVQRRHTSSLLAIPGVVGTAVTTMPDGKAGVMILAERSGITGLPQLLDGVPVTVRVTGRIMIYSDPTKRQRPAPMGFSVGHPLITAGTIGARVRDALGRVYILSNNHVLANSNNATIGDPEYQPGPFDGGTAADQIATLTDFQQISFATNGANTIDAAIAMSSTDLLDNTVPVDEGYGMPNSAIWGDADGDGFFDNRDALLGLNVQKYGRTTHETHGTITGVNATVDVCYAVSGFTCTKVARYVDQLIISPGTFSGGGDSGSLIVTDDANLNPVALLFAGSSSVTIANRIDLVLNRFGVTIDGFAPAPPGPLTDLAVIGLGTPSVVVRNSTTSVSVTVRNFGNQDVGAFDVTVQDTTEHVSAGTVNVSGLVAGGSATVSLPWTPSTIGDHVLVARQMLADDRPANDQRSLTVPVAAPVTDIAVSSFTLPGQGQVTQGHIVNVGVTVANAGNQTVASSFDVTLRDATDGVTIGTLTVNGLAAGTNKFLTFSWDLTSSSLGDHTLIATQSFADDNTANDQRSATITVNPKPTDIAVTAITGPARVPVGDTAHILVTVTNTGELDVTTTFNVELADGYNGPVIGTKAVPGLAVGASATVDIAWNTTGAALNGHTLFATQKLPDAVWNNNAIAISVIVTPPADIAISMTAPTTVVQGANAAIAVSVANVGGQSETANFDITLRDATAGVTIGTQTIVGGLQTNGNTTRSFTWNTAGAGLGSHTLVATHSYPDGNAGNNQASATVSVSLPSTDVGVTSVTAPASVGKGATATVNVTVQNVGSQNITSSFNVVLSDQTAGGSVIGTQAVSSLAAGASATRSFSWNTGTAALGSHTLVATQTLSDDNPSNNQRSVSVSVTPTPADIALASITAPGQVTVGDTAPVVVTVQNVGGEDVASSFDVVLTDGTAGNTVVGTQTIAGLAAGARATRTFGWNTAGAAVAGHILTATQKLPDANSSNNAQAIAITVNPPSVHVGNLDGFTVNAPDGSWTASVRITTHDSRHNPVDGVTVHGSWNSGPDVQCVTSSADGNPGTCVLSLASLPITTRSAYFGINSLAMTGYTYKPAMNHDPDGSSNGYSLYVRH